MKSWKKRLQNGWKCVASNNSGMTLIELIIAVFILSLIVVPLFLSFASSAKTTYRSREIGDATLAAENIAEYLIGSDFYSESVTTITSGLATQLNALDSTTATAAILNPSTTGEDATTSITDATLLFGDITETTDGNNVTESHDTFQLTIEDMEVGSTTLDAVVTLDRVDGEASAINSVLLTDSAQADCMFAQSKGDGVTSDPDVLSFKEFVDAAKVAGTTISTTTYDDAAMKAITGLTADRTIEITINKYANDVESGDTDADTDEETVDQWSIVITYSYVYSYYGFTYETSYQVIEDEFEVESKEWPNIQVLFYPWYHGDENIYIRNNNQQDANDAGFNLYLAKQEHTSATDLSTWETNYGKDNDIAVRLYNEKSITTGYEPKIYSNLGTRFTDSGTESILSGSYYRIYQMEFFYTTSDFESVESLLEESERNRYYNITIEITVAGDTDPIYELETTKLQ